jgi:hypothetical protein
MSSVTKDQGVSSNLLFSGSGINFPRPLYLPFNPSYVCLQDFYHELCCIAEEGEVRVRFLEDGIQRVVKAEGELIGRVVHPDPAFFLIVLDPDPAFFLMADPDPVLNPGF